MKSEHQFLIDLLSVKKPDSVSFSPASLTETEWRTITSLAESHRLAPWLFSRLDELGILSFLPPEAACRLRNLYLGSVARSSQFTAGLSRMLIHLKENNVPVIVLKGPHLAELVYKDWALRPMSDLDLMVEKDDLGKAVNALQELGYSATSDFHIASQVEINADLPVMKKNGLNVELHWSIEKPSAPFKIDIEGIWKRAEHIDFGGAEALALSKEDLLLHLCIHAAYHHRLTFGLSPLLDIAEIINHHGNEIDWFKVKSLAEEWHAVRCVSLTLQLVKEILGASAPSDTGGKQFVIDQNETVLKIAKKRIFETVNVELPLTHNISRVWEVKGLKAKTGILLRNIFPSRNLLASKYPVRSGSRLIYLYYPVRLKDLIVQYRKTVFSLLLGESQAIAQLQKEEQGNLLADWLIS